jgi:hypothetical protein
VGRIRRGASPPYLRTLTGRSHAVSSDGTQATVGAPGIEQCRPRLTQAGSYTPTIIERSGPAIRAALLAHAPERCAQFEAELRSALARAAKDLDLSGPQAVLTHWHAVATMAANPLTDDEREQIERATTGDLTGLSTRYQDENGNWVRM